MLGDIGVYDGGFENFPPSPSTAARERARVQLDDAIEGCVKPGFCLVVPFLIPQSQSVEDMVACQLRHRQAAWERYDEPRTQPLYVY